MILIKTAIEILKILLLIGAIKLIYDDTNRIFKAFFKHVERKLLVIHSIKLFAISVIVNEFKIFSPYNKILLTFNSILLLIFLSMLTLRQVELSIKELHGEKKVTAFKYNKFVEYILYLLTLIMNRTELRSHKRELKEKSKELMYVAMFPVQKYIAVEITGIEFAQRKEKFITDAQLEEIKKDLEPGDILLKRNDWQATNLGISGFWTHAGLYIGNLEQMDEYFRDVDSLNGEKFSNVLKSINEELFNALQNDAQLAVIEAIEEGVSLKPLSNIAKVDYFSSLRPKVSKEQKIEAIKKAFGFIGLPYDYHFDIKTNNALVCSEVIKKSYSNILTIPYTKMLGKKVILPNNIAKKYTKEKMKEAGQLDFVLFYDLDIHTRKAFKSTEEEFSKTFNRNVFHYNRKRDILRYLTTILDLDLHKKSKGA